MSGEQGPQKKRLVAALEGGSPAPPAFARACAVLAEQPAWLPTRLGSGREALETVKVTFPTGKCLRHTPRRREPEDLLAPYDASVPDVWDAGDLPEVEDLRRDLQQAMDRAFGTA